MALELNKDIPNLEKDNPLRYKIYKTLIEGLSGTSDTSDMPDFSGPDFCTPTGEVWVDANGKENPLTVLNQEAMQQKIKEITDIQTKNTAYLFAKAIDESIEESTTKVEDARHADYADDADKWDGQQFADYLDQGVRTTDDVKHKSVSADSISVGDSAAIHSDGSATLKKADIDGNLSAGGDIEAEGTVTSSGFYTPGFVQGMEGGMGAALYDKDGEGYAELDYLKVRKGLVVTKIVVNEIKSVGGVMVVSPANGTVDYVEEDENGRITIWLKEDNMFLIGDLVRWGNWDAHNQVLRAGWCQVRQSDSAERCFVIYRSDMNEYMTLPAADDALVLMGNVQDRLRQGFVIIDSSEGEPHISAYSEVSSRTLTPDMLKARFGSLENLNTEQWGLLSGYGIMSQNAYLTGDLLIRSTSTKASDLIVSTVNVYYQNGSMTVAPAKPADINNLNGWSEEMPEYRKGMFIWQCSVIRRANGNIEISDPFCISGKDGEDTVNVEIYTDNGNVILNGQGEITLTARVYRGSDDITDSISPAYFSWERTSTYPQGDENWNLRHKGCGNVITVTKDDITVRANFDCIVNI